MEPVPERLTSAGTTLRNTREEWGLTVEEVADNLNLGVEAIEAIESDDYSSLPGTTFVKGYIRSYAKLLQLDVEGLMGNIDLQPERITEIPSTRAALRMKGKTRNREKVKKKSGVLKWLLTFILIGFVVIVGLSQLPKLGIASLNDLLAKIGVEVEQTTGVENENQLLIPQQSGSTENSSIVTPSTSSSNSSSSSSEQPKGALIRIE